MALPVANTIWIFALVMAVLGIIGLFMLRTVAQQNQLATPVTLTVAQTPYLPTTPLHISTVTRDDPFTVTPEIAISPPSPPPKPNLTVEPPLCYDTIAGIQCYGVIRNPLPYPVKNLRFTTEITPDDLVNFQQFSLEQRGITGESFAPYRLLIATDDPDQLTITTHFISADYADDIPATLITSHDRGVYQPDSGLYIITTTVSNTSADTVNNSQLVVTLFDDDRIAGYRVIRLVEPIAAGDSRAVRVNLLPESASGTLNHHIHAESIDALP